MIARRRILLICVLALLAIVLRPARATSIQIAGGASVAGIVVDPAGTPVAGATVMLVTASPDGAVVATVGPDRRDTKTDANGAFQFSELASRTYVLRCSAPGYPLGGRLPRLLALRDNDRFTGLILRLEKSVAVSGVVRDEAGRPIAGAEVHFLIRTIRAGREAWGSRGTVIAEPSGRYAREGLAAGVYKVAAYFSQTTFPQKVQQDYHQAQTSRGSVSDAFFARFDGFGAARPSGRGAPVGDWILERTMPGGARLHSVTPISPDAILVYPTTFHPSALALDQASHLDLAPGASRADADITVRATRGFMVTGRVRDGAEPAALVGLRLKPVNEVTDFAIATITNRAQTVTDEKGLFTMLGVPPGDYELIAETVPPPLAGAPRPIRPTPPLPVPGRYGRTYVTVRADVSGVDVALEPLKALQGRMVFNGSDRAAPTPAEIQKAVIRISEALPAGLPRSTQASVTADGLFAAAGLRPNPQAAYVTPVGYWVLDKWMINGRDAADEFWTPTDPVTSVEASFTTSWTDLIVDLRVPDDMPVTDVRVMMLPTDARERLARGSLGRRFNESLPIRRGEIRFAGSPPGEYAVVAFQDPQVTEIDDRLLARLLPVATRVSLKAGLRHTVTVTAVGR